MANATSYPRVGVPVPGYSDRVNDPEILAAMKKNRRAAGIFAFIVVPLPLIGFAIYSKVTGDMEMKEALFVGLCVSAVFLVFALVSLIRNRVEKSYEAVVEDQFTRQVSRQNNDDRDGFTDTYTEYVTVARTSDGKKKKIVEREGSQVWAYRYLNEGDRFMYHPQFNFPYERFDKASAPYIACVSCTTQNPVTADRCSKCGLPLLK